MRKYRILELVITRDQTRNALHAPSRSLQESPQEGTAGTEPIRIRAFSQHTLSALKTPANRLIPNVDCRNSERRKQHIDESLCFTWILI